LNVRSSLLVHAGILLFLTAGCATAPPPSPDAAPDYDSAPTYPHWAGRTVTWSKLGDIEEWLQGDGPRQYPEYVPTAELELAEGRLTLAEKEAQGLSPAMLAARLRSAESGFQTVLARRGLRPHVEQRAQRGLERIAALRAGPAVAAAPKPAAPAAAAPESLKIQPRSSWLAASPKASRLTPASGGWNRITVHHSAKDSKEIGKPTSGNVADTIKAIQSFHTGSKSWGDIGYHFLIDPTGRIWQGRTLEWQGAHATGNNNVSNIGICLLGDFNAERPSQDALAALERLVEALCERHHIARSRVYGHRHFTNTECPGDALMAWVSRYAANASH